jgi:hypothetical protein
VTTKLETNVRVVVPGSVPGWDHSKVKEDPFAIMEALAFRKIVGTNDTCTRNFICCGGKVYSIDDPALNKTTPYMWKTQLVKPKADYEAALTAVWDRLTETFAKWRLLLADEPFALAMLEVYSNKTAWAW